MEHHLVEEKEVPGGWDQRLVHQQGAMVYHRAVAMAESVGVGVVVEHHRDEGREVQEVVAVETRQASRKEVSEVEGVSVPHRDEGREGSAA